MLTLPPFFQILFEKILFEKDIMYLLNDLLHKRNSSKMSNLILSILIKMISPPHYQNDQKNYLKNRLLLKQKLRMNDVVNYQVQKKF